MGKYLLTKEQRAAGLTTAETEHFLSILDTTNNKTVAVFSSSGATIQEIQKVANDYLIERDGGKI